jgi:hypothetical protein
MIDFARDCELSDFENDWDPSIILGVRLAYSYFIQNKYAVGFSEFRTQCSRAQFLQSFTLYYVLKAIRTDLQLKSIDDKLFIVLHLDEVQKIFEFDARVNSKQPKGLFQLLMYVHSMINISSDIPLGLRFTTT